MPEPTPEPTRVERLRVELSKHHKTSGWGPAMGVTCACDHWTAASLRRTAGDDGLDQHRAEVVETFMAREMAKWRNDSVILNSVGWTLAQALGEVAPAATETTTEVDVEALADRVLASLQLAERKS